MQIKNISDFDLQECEKFLQENPQGEMADEVKVRQLQLIDALLCAREDRKKIYSYEDKIEWMDFSLFYNDFNEEKKNEIFSFLRKYWYNFIMTYMILLIII